MKKREYPKTVFRKKLIKGVFWTGFALVFFFSIIAIVRAGNTSAANKVEQPDTEQTSKVNLAAGEGAQTFAQDFAAEYFSWENTDEAKKNRVDRLSHYLANGLDEQAGLSFEGMEWNSNLTGSQVWKVEETGKDTALVTLKIKHELNRKIEPDPKEVEKAKKKKKKPPKAREETSGPHEKYFVVPVKTDGQSFVVNEIPYFVAAPSKPDITAKTEVDTEGKIIDSDLEKDIQGFLGTFFKVYTTGTQEELQYYVTGDEIKSMSNIITLQEVKDILVKKGKSKNQYVVHATVTFKENKSQAQVIYPYELSLVKKDDRWFVQEIKNK